MIRAVSLQEERYLCQILQSSRDNEKIEEALERLCSLMRAGFRINDPVTVCRALTGIQFHESEKIRRWVLNAIAHVGQRAGIVFMDGLKQSIIMYINDLPMLRYAVAAFFAVRQNDEEVLHWLKENGVTLEPATLIASAPFSLECKRRLHKLDLNFEKADAHTLQNASILCGINQMPDGVFSGKHPYEETIGKLNQHDDRLVRQYSVWAVKENPFLSVRHLGFRPVDIVSLDFDVMKWAYPTLAADQAFAPQFRDVLEEGTRHQNEIIRQNLAGGLVDTYFPELENMTVDWYANENHPETRVRLIEHMAGNSDKCSDYLKIVLDRYEAVETADERARIEIAAEGTVLYGALQRLNTPRPPSLFSQLPRGDFHMTVIKQQNNSTNNVTVNGNTGRDINVGSNLVNHAMETVSAVHDDQLRSLLEEMISLVEGLKQNEEEERKILGAIEALAKNPSKTLADKLLQYMSAYATVGNVAIVTGKLGSWALGIPL